MHCCVYQYYSIAVCISIIPYALLCVSVLYRMHCCVYQYYTVCIAVCNTVVSRCVLCVSLIYHVHCDLKFDIDYTDLKKSESTNISATEAREHLINDYQNHIKIFTDGSLLGSLDSGAGFVIPELTVQKYFYLGKGFSIFTSELYAVSTTYTIFTLLFFSLLFTFYLC